MPPDPRVHAGTSAWVEREGHLLMLKRAGKVGTSQEGYGTWSIPGGWIDFPEDDKIAAVRETYEETGVKVKAVRRLRPTVDMSDRSDFVNVTLVVECEYVSGEPTNMEPEKCDGVEWVPLGNLYKMPLFRPLQNWLIENRPDLIQVSERCEDLGCKWANGVPVHYHPKPGEWL